MPRPSREEWQRHIAERPLNERKRAWIGKYERILMNEGSQLRVAHRADIIALDDGASLCWTLNVGRRHVRLPVPSRAYQQGLIQAVVVIPSHHEILGLGIALVLDVVQFHVAPVHLESVHNCEHVKMRWLHQFVCPNDI